MHNTNESLPVAFLVCLVALISPLVLIPIEGIAPYPYVIEEMVKAVFIFIVIKTCKRNNQLATMLLAVFLIALSENIFYSSNFIAYGILYSFWKRFLITTGLHFLTALIIFLPSQKRINLIVPATLLAIAAHYYYNQFVLAAFR